MSLIHTAVRWLAHQVCPRQPKPITQPASIRLLNETNHAERLAVRRLRNTI